MNFFQILNYERGERERESSAFPEPLFLFVLLELYLQRTVESWLRKERDEERKRRKERKACGLPEFERQIEGSRVTGDPAHAATRALNNGWAAGRLHSTIAGEENFVLSSNRVLR